MGSCSVKKETWIWLTLISLIALDFGLTFLGITTNKAQELNPYTKGLWLDPYANFVPLFLYTFLSGPFMFYGFWTFFGKNNKYLYFNIVYFAIIVINNIAVALL